MVVCSVFKRQTAATTARTPRALTGNGHFARAFRSYYTNIPFPLRVFRPPPPFCFSRFPFFLPFSLLTTLPVVVVVARHRNVAKPDRLYNSPAIPALPRQPIVIVYKRSLSHMTNRFVFSKMSINVSRTGHERESVRFFLFKNDRYFNVFYFHIVFLIIQRKFRACRTT